ncbi:MAG: hypothetical protein HY587_02530 [Candidatus Omnitrophica bacterium]|nr:hypothetical protein [Candidatus Omnitrophota bacterium]
MNFNSLMNRVGHLSVIDTEILFAGLRTSEQASLKVQITRWTATGKLVQLRRGMYLFAAPYRKTEPQGLYLASVLTKPSYISLEKALEYYGLIPEGVSIYTSVTTKRPARFDTAAGHFDYRHIQIPLFWGYRAVTLDRQTGFMASPEKALLDFIYFRRPELSEAYLKELRLQNLEAITLKQFYEYAKRFRKQRIEKAAKLLGSFIEHRKRRSKS